MSLTYEEFMEKLDESDDISVYDDDDQEYLPYSSGYGEDVHCSYLVIDTQSEEEMGTSAETPLKKKKLQETTWRKRLLTLQSREWKLESADDMSVEEASLPEPYALFKEYIPDHIMTVIAEKTNQYAVNIDGQSLNTNSNEIETLIGMHLKIGTLGFPRLRMYWTSKSRIPDIADAMPFNRFSKLRSCLHLVDANEKPNTDDRLWKVRPIIDSVRKRCNKVAKEEFYSVDEMMIPFTGKLDIKQYIKGKPNPWGIKLFVLCTSDGLVTDFFDYQGKTTEIDDNFKSFGLGGSAVLQLCKILPSGCNFKIAFDNYFTSLPLIRHLKRRDIFSVGTIRSNRTERCPLLNENQLRKKGRGSHDYRLDVNNDIIVLRWLDNKSVTLASSFIDVGKNSEIKRWDKKSKQYVKFPRPDIVETYNLKMGGVDLIGQYVELYRIFIRSRKWTLRVIFHMVDLAACNSWLEYRKIAQQLCVPKKEILDLLAFREEITDGLLRANKYWLVREKELSTASHRKPSIMPKPAPSTATRFDNLSHWPIFLNQKNAARCANIGCNQKSMIACSKCNKALCLKRNRNCFQLYHNA